jgi:hypothetical protein
MAVAGRFWEMTEKSWLKTMDYSLINGTSKILSIVSGHENNGHVEQGHLSAALVHLGNIAYRVGNKQLFFDGENERFIDNADANQLIKTSYREKYKMPEKV